MFKIAEDVNHSYITLHRSHFTHNLIPTVLQKPQKTNASNKPGDNHVLDSFSVVNPLFGKAMMIDLDVNNIEFHSFNDIPLPDPEAVNQVSFLNLFSLPVFG